MLQETRLVLRDTYRYASAITTPCYPQARSLLTLFDPIIRTTHRFRLSTRTFSSIRFSSPTAWQVIIFNCTPVFIPVSVNLVIERSLLLLLLDLLPGLWLLLFLPCTLQRSFIHSWSFVCANSSAYFYLFFPSCSFSNNEQRSTFFTPRSPEANSNLVQETQALRVG